MTPLKRFKKRQKTSQYSSKRKDILMTTQELVQRVHQLAEAYNQTHEGTLAINYHKGQYRLIHSKAPTFSYYISNFNPLTVSKVSWICISIVSSSEKGLKLLI